MDPTLDVLLLQAFETEMNLRNTTITTPGPKLNRDFEEGRSSIPVLGAMLQVWLTNWVNLRTQLCHKPSRPCEDPLTDNKLNVIIRCSLA